MNIRSRLFATVAFPLLSLSVAIPPGLAAELMKPVVVAQADGAAMPAEDGGAEEVPKKRKPRGEQAEQPDAGEKAEPRKRKAEQQQDGEEAPQRKRKAEQPQDEARPAEAEDAAPTRKQRKAEQPQSEEQPAEAGAEKNAGEEKKRQREERNKKREAAQEQDDAQPAEAATEAKPSDDKPLSAEDKKRLREERVKKRQAAQEQDGAKPADTATEAKPGDDKPLSAEDKKRLREERIKKRQAEQDKDGAKPSEAATDAKPGDDQPLSAAEKKRLREERIKKRHDALQSDDQQPPVDGKAATDKAMPDEDDTTEAKPRGKPRPEIVDERTEEEKRALARDPSKSNETVVLPVDNGAAVLDSDKDADNSGGGDVRDKRRRERERARADDDQRPPPRSDADAQSGGDRDRRRPSRDEIDAANREEGRRVERVPEFNLGGLVDVLTGNDRRPPSIRERGDNRTVIDFGDQVIVRSDDRPRLRRNAQESYYDELPRGRTRETIERPDGTRVVTIYNQYGDILQRSRIDRSGREYLMVYAPEADDGPRRPAIDIGDELPPMRLTVPVDDYIIDTSSQPDRDYYEFLAEPPVERVERVYSIDEVRNSARIRDKVRRIDLDTVTFATGSSEVPSSQAKSLSKVADAIIEVIDKDPGETFLIEGHTDAVGSDQSNLVLSDERAESVAALLTDVYEIPPENLITQGYGERFLKVRTDGPSQENRRVTIRRVTPLVRPVAEK